jgi:thioredoxin 1
MHHPDNTAALDALILASAGKPILLKFTAEWCGPCKMIQPQLDEMSAKYEGKVVFVSVDVDVHGEFAQKHNIQAMPTIFILQDGVCVSEVVVGASIDKIRALLEKY